MRHDVFARYGGHEASDLEGLWKEASLDLLFRTRLLGLSAWSDFLIGVARRLYTAELTKRQRAVSESLAPKRRLAETLGLVRPLADSKLPVDSLSVELPFRLAEPYFSRDDSDFYVVDNPVRKDRALALPMVAASGWKGNLRSAAVRHLESLAGTAEGLSEGRVRVALLFGDEKGEREPEEAKEGDMSSYLRGLSGEAHALYVQKMRQLFPPSEEQPDGFLSHQGRLHFYPTFFERLGLQIINPHDRKRRVGTNPILFEVVPPGASGWFTLLYYPLDLIGKSRNVRLMEMAEDLRLLARFLVRMFREEGFSAKKTSGFGLAEDRLAGEGLLRLAVEGGDSGPSPRTFSFTSISGLEHVADVAASEIEGIAHGR